MEQIKKDVVTNYKDFLKLLEELKLSGKHQLFLHACCAPCSSEVIDLLQDVFDITVFYYNPNIHPLEEYNKRYEQFDKLPYTFKIIKGEYNYDKYFEAVKGFEDYGEFSERCYHCFYFRMEKAAKIACENSYEYFTTTLSISPYKNSKWINEIGMELEKKYNIKYLYSDFKKQDGYKKSIELSKKYNLYRQEYCGCIFCLKEAIAKIKNKKNEIDDA